MKKLLTFFLACFVLTGAAFSQQLQKVNVSVVNDLPAVAGTSTMGLNKTAGMVSCSEDTVLYTQAKATGLSTISLNNSSSADLAGQYFDAPQSITISGFRFYAYSEGTTSVTVSCQVYNAGLDSLPTGVPLASTTVIVDTAFGGGQLSVLEKTATFSSPVTVTGPYVLVVQNSSANSIGAVFNSYAAADGANEWLSSFSIFGTWYRSYLVNVGGTPMNADCIFEPFVTYDLEAGFTASQNCLVTPDSVTFTNASSPILWNRMYSLAAYLGTPEISSYYDFGDGGAGYAVDTTYSYATAGAYTVSLFDTLFGWTTNCASDTSWSFGTAATAAFGHSPNGLMVNFMDTLMNADSLMYDFGDGSGTSTSSNPSYTYGADGSYLVTLIAYGACGNDTVWDSVLVCAPMAANYTFLDQGLGQVDFTDASTGTPVSWSWDFGDGSGTSTSQNPSYTYAASGPYTVTLIVTNLCGDMDTLTQTVTVVIAGMEEDFKQSFSVYPNPANEVLNIEAKDVNGSSEIMIYDLRGQLLLQSDVNDISNGAVISTGTLTPGIYILEIRNEGRRLIHRIEVMH